LTATAETLQVALDELDAFVEALHRLRPDQWQRPTELVPWTVADLASHVIEIAWRQAEALYRQRVGTADPPGPARVATEPVELPTLAAVAAAHLRGAASAPFDETPPVPLPFAPLPASVAAQVLAIEYGLHRYDLHRALDDLGALRPEVACYILEQARVYLVVIGQAAPDGTTLRIESDTVATTLKRASDRWDVIDDATGASTIAGSDEEIALFIMGRLRAGEAGLRTTDPAAAANFKTLFPGP
jgi:uncharacterized protein (TIGR03083 family)